MLSILTAIQAWNGNLLQKLLTQESVKAVNVLYCDEIRDGNS